MRNGKRNVRGSHDVVERIEIAWLLVDEGKKVVNGHFQYCYATVRRGTTNVSSLGTPTMVFSLMIDSNWNVQI
jgi:hypothetical protein